MVQVQTLEWTAELAVVELAAHEDCCALTLPNLNGYVEGDPSVLGNRGGRREKANQ
jgi:hypothetical protein